jgi:hypothetical protein
MPVDPSRAAHAGRSAKRMIRGPSTAVGTRPLGIATGLVLLTAVALALWCAPSAAAALKFAPPTTFPVGLGPVSIATGDFNGDSDPDLAVANISAATVSVLLGAAGGDFGAQTTFIVGAKPWSLATDDFNGDGDPDLVTANANSDNVSVLLGGAGGGFGTPTKFPVAAGSAPSFVATGDFNGDGDPDLAVTSMADDSDDVSVLLGGAGGSFGPRTSLPVGAPQNSFGIGDFNGDGDPDLAVANRSNPQISVLLGGAGASFGAPTEYYNVPAIPTSVAVGDFNGDTDPDLAVATYFSLVSVLLGGPGGSFGAQTANQVPGGAAAVDLGDFNGDADPDLAVANNSSNAVSVLLGGAGGSFGAADSTPVSGENGAGDAAVGDFNADADADPDLAVANYTGIVSVLLNSRVSLDPGSLTFPPTVAGGGSERQTVVLTNDRAADLSVSNVALAGADAGSFATSEDTCSGATVAPGGTCHVRVRFRPVRVGDHGARLEFTDDAVGGVQSAPLSGTGTPQVRVSPNPVYFGSRPDSTTSGPQSVSLVNLGVNKVVVSGVALTGADAGSFRKPPEFDKCSGSTVPVGGWCNVVVRFRPDGVGSKSAVLEFTDDALGSPHRVTLVGTGTPGPWLTQSSQGLKFGRVPLGTTTATKTVTLTNTGSAAMKISAISVGGANPGDFIGLSETCTALASLGPDQSCSAKIAFRPTATGVRQARLTIDDTAPGHPHHVDLQGTGT